MLLTVSAGDSAGGNLIFSLAARLRAYNKLCSILPLGNIAITSSAPVLNPPTQQIQHPIIGLVGISPWINLATQDFGITNKIYRKMGGLDYLRPMMGSLCASSYIHTTLDETTENIPKMYLNPTLSKVPIGMYKNRPSFPLISPIYASYSNWTFGPILFVAGGAEIMNKDHVEFIIHVNSFQTQNGPVVLEDFEPEMVHAYPTMPSFFGSVSYNALERISAFMSALL
jgi:acetyl esterase/lipase